MPRSDFSDLELIEGRRELSFYALRVEQPIGAFYSAVIPAKRLVEICYFDIRGLTQREDFTEFMGIQRELDPKRVADIKRYVRTVDPSFPTAIVLAVDEHCATFEDVNLVQSGNHVESKLVLLTLKNYPDHNEGLDPVLYRDIARVIDGQHRIAGLIGHEGSEFDLNVSIFVGADVATQASIFSTVNLAQTKVNKSLVYDLYEYAKTRSPEKTCHDVAVVLDRDRDSPFYQRIRRLGVATSGRFDETLAQATFVKGLIQYISKDVVSDRDMLRRGREAARAEPGKREELFLRDFFLNKKDEVIADIIWDYFDVVRDKWPLAWSKTGQGWVLNKTAGYVGLMRFLKPLYLSHIDPGEVLSKRWIERTFASINVDDYAFQSGNVRPGTSGEKYIYELLLRTAELGPRHFKGRQP